MGEDQWEAICQHLDLCFAGEFPDDKADAYATFLGGLDAADVMGAIHVLAHSGQRFVPSVGEILGVIDEATGPPAFDRAWRSIDRALSRYGVGDVDYAEAALEDQHPAVLAWVRSYGWRRLTCEPVNDPDYGGAVMHRLGRSYREHTAERMLRERAERRGLPGAAVGQIGTPPGQLTEGSG